jgi:drug/metabolite transporter (DMT)-like permease
MAVGIACLGVLIMTYGDSGSEDTPPLAGSEGDLPVRAIAEEKGQVGTLFGDLLGLFASFLVGLYEVRNHSTSNSPLTTILIY